MLKNLSVAAGVEKYALTVILHQRGKSPGLGQSRGLSKCVVENRDAIGGLTCAKGRKQKNNQHKITSKSKSHDVLLQRRQNWRAPLSSGIVAPVNVPCQGHVGTA